jgi:AmmeMemoRadiSam system protein B
MIAQGPREAVVAGSFYPDNPAALSKMINVFLENTQKENLKNIRGLVCPHAGYIYSGQVAACSYRQIEDCKYDCAVIIAPSHSEFFNYCSVYDGTAYRTPLGTVKVDTQRARLLTEAGNNPEIIKLSSAGHRREHSLEVQLPFLQVVLGDILIVPVVIGKQDKTNIESLGNAIGNTFAGDNILVVASTDLSHYHNYNTASAFDSSVIEYVERFNADDLTRAVDTDSVEMCGGGPVAAAMIACKLLGANKSRVLCYRNSGDVSGDRSAVVGYLSAVFFQEPAG